MRVTTNLIFDQNLRAIYDNQGRLADIQNQLASGKKLLRPSDDPVGSVQVIRLTEELDKISQYKRNIDLATNNLEMQETTLQSINDVINRARVLTVQAGNGIVSKEDRKAIGAEIEQIRNQVLDLMNSQNASGEYIFAGYQSNKRAFEFSPANTEAPIQFVGDDGVNAIQLSDSVKIQTTTSGKTLFEDVRARLDLRVTGTNGLSLDTYDVESQDDLNEFHRLHFDPSNPANNQFRIEILPGNQAQVFNQGTGAVLDTISYATGQALKYAGMTFNINATAGQSFDFELPRPTKTNFAETLHNFSLALRSDTISDGDFQRAVSNALVGLDNGLNKMSRENSSVGARLNIAESVRSSLLDAEVANERARGAIQDVDFAQASADFAKQETALNAAFASFPRIANLSLFDFI